MWEVLTVTRRWPRLARKREFPEENLRKAKQGDLQFALEGGILPPSLAMCKSKVASPAKGLASPLKVTSELP